MIGVNIPAHARYAIINDSLRRGDSRLTVSELCKLAKVSRSGYYAWVANQKKRKEKEDRDREDFLLIEEAYNYRGYKKGARSIHMRLLHRDPPIIMNVKKIRRLMKKFGLKCPFRKLNPYRQMARKIQTGHVAPNYVNREFSKFGPRECLLTDITYHCCPTEFKTAQILSLQ